MPGLRAQKNQGPARGQKRDARGPDFWALRPRERRRSRWPLESGNAALPAASCPPPAFFIMNPLVSVVIPVLADADEVERLVDEIAPEPAVEVIVVDGGPDRRLDRLDGRPGVGCCGRQEGVLAR